MRTHFTTLLLCFLFASGFSQQDNVKTKSVAIDDLITFVINNYQTEGETLHNITFLLQMNNDNLGVENEIVMRQAFKLLAERLHEDSKISIVTHSKFSGVSLQPTSPKDLQKITNVLADPKAHIVDFYKDGIGLAYKHAEENEIEDYENTVVMIRIKEKAVAEKVDVKKERKAKKNKKGEIILAAAIGLLPEIISLIKD